MLDSNAYFDISMLLMAVGGIIWWLASLRRLSGKDYTAHWDWAYRIGCTIPMLGMSIFIIAAESLVVKVSFLLWFSLWMAACYGMARALSNEGY